ncbi:hypothetical protein [Antrihabitans sp. YC2-6]|uniref:hypothetical protein n=1 Tax=Antrihabitans sp. YC2-6 TaxID=2799498 RepID=UPI001F292B6F|nr:hypothetical protein [Antrihabitans sp. YC2-6]
MRVDDNVELLSDGTTRCVHCQTALGDSTAGTLARALTRESASQTAGPSVHAAPSLFTDRPIVLRQLFCPSCLVLLATEIVPSDEPGMRSWNLTQKAPG